MDLGERALKVSEEHGGKIEVISKVEVNNRDELAVAYTPGVAEVCKAIAKNKEDVYRYTSKQNLVAVVTDGTAVLGLGDIGPEAAIPVMEGKCILFKQFADVDAVPIALNTTDPDEIVKIVQALEPSFGGINLEDIKAPRCFEIERRLKETMNIPIFHDDQHGTAIVVLAATLNALKLAGKELRNSKIVINGAGAAGIATAKLFREAGAEEILICDRVGILNSQNPEIEERHREIAELTNRNHLEGSLETALDGADVFIGLSGPDALKKEWIASMAERPTVFALANPVPEIMPEDAKAGGAYIVGTGRSDFPNQINNVLAFPGIFRGALDARVNDITPEMLIAAAKGIAEAVKEEDLNVENVIPDVFTPGISQLVANKIMEVAKQ